MVEYLTYNEMVKDSTSLLLNYVLYYKGIYLNGIVCALQVQGYWFDSNYLHMYIFKTEYSVVW